MEKITDVIDIIFVFIFLIATCFMTILLPAIGFCALVGIGILNDKTFRNEKFDDFIDEKVEFYHDKYFNENDTVSKKTFRTEFSKMFCKLCKAFVSTRGCESLVQGFYLLKTRDSDYDVLYEIAIETFNN